MREATSTPVPSQHPLRVELEALMLGDLSRPAGGESEELSERTVRDRYLVGVLALGRPAGAGAYAWSVLDLGHVFHETKQEIRFTIKESVRCEVLQRLLNEVEDG